MFDPRPSSSSDRHASGAYARQGGNGTSGRHPGAASGRHRAADSSSSGRLPLPAYPPRREHPDVIELTDANFGAEVLSCDRPVVVDFWAETCRPCRQQEVVIEQLAEELRDRVKVGRVDVFVNQKVLEEFQIKGVPHLMVVANGEVVLELVGDHNLDQLRHHLRSSGLIP